MIDAADALPHDLPLALLAEAFGQGIDLIGDAIDEDPAGRDDVAAAVIAAVVLPAESGTGPAARF